ncbi:alcohol oxidase [Decorospora gaudefroyi]|uniref:Alcohol oxidase n=1 Tax=Decorospora gaudefroyi TaxID=184978 RepID=A0A6A5KVI7_9PLEO|nr:alcohol oxidase [Decorospora gaudefroyi]
MKLQHLLLPAITLASPLHSYCESPKSLANDDNTYDYIVTGSGPGGGTIATNLARAGHSVLLVEAGSDATSDIRTQILSLNDFGNPNVAWHFFVRHSDDEERTKRYNLLVWRLTNGVYWVGRDPTTEGHQGAERLGVFYPRGATLGGSAINNAAATFLPSESDWDFFDRGVEDGIWNGKEMRKYFEKIEHNNYLEPGTPGHGFTGWLQTNIADPAVWAGATLRFKVFQAALKLIGRDPTKVLDYITSDPNYLDPKRDQTEGLWSLPFHVTPTWKRFSPRDYILETRNATNANGTRKYPIHLQLESLVTKVLFDKCGGNGTKPRAIGVEYLQGKSVYRADPRYNSTTTGTLSRVFARKEVIVSGGTFNSPQLLQLSGIGPKALLDKFNIPVVSDLPGVGRNLQDNYEVPIYGNAQINLVEDFDPNAPACTWGAPGDPCVDLWYQGKGPYARGGTNSNSFLIQTQHAVENERDMLMFASVGGIFNGFAPTTNQTRTPLPPTTFSWSTVKMHPQNTAGFVQIQSDDPQDVPEVNTNYFVDGQETDIPAILDTVAFVRKSFASTEAPVGPVVSVSPPCPPADILETGYCRDEEVDKDWIKDQAFGHHPTSTNKVGPDSDPMAVLDTRLRVRGVQGLRVVDASAFPRCPGAFPAVATYMLSERATDLVLEDADKW